MSSQPVEPVSTQTESNPNTEQTYISISNYPFATDADFQSGLASILGHPQRPATSEEVTQNHDLVLQAQCFFFARKHKTEPIDFTDYKRWVETSGRDGASQDLEAASVQISSGTDSGIVDTPFTGNAGQPDPVHDPQPTSASTTTDPVPPPYPTSFADIVELITNNKPIPGIVEVPKTVLDLGSSKRDDATRRKKPWEKDTVQENTDDIPVQEEKQPGVEEGITPAESKTATQDEPASDGIGVEPGSKPKPKGRRKEDGVLHILQPNAVPSSGLIAND